MFPKALGRWIYTSPVLGASLPLLFAMIHDDLLWRFISKSLFFTCCWYSLQALHMLV
jgi:hypothetical protein